MFLNRFCRHSVYEFSTLIIISPHPKFTNQSLFSHPVFMSSITTPEQCLWTKWSDHFTRCNVHTFIVASLDPMFMNQLITRQLIIQFPNQLNFWFSDSWNLWILPLKHNHDVPAVRQNLVLPPTKLDGLHFNLGLRGWGCLRGREI